MEAREDVARATAYVLMLLAFAMLVGGVAAGSSPNSDVVRAIYFAATSVIVAMALVVWALY